MIGVFAAFFVHSALADCSSFNLYDQKQNPFYQIPVSEQGPAYTCYAHTAAQMVDYYRISKGFSSQLEVSPLWVALNHKVSQASASHWFHWEPNTLGNSYLLWALQDLRSKGNCSRAKMQEGMLELQRQWKLPFKLSPDELLYLLEQLWPKIGTLSTDLSTIEAWIQSDEDLREFDHDLKEKNRLPLKLMIQKMLLLPNLAHSRIRHSRALDFFSEDLFKSCKTQGLASLELPKIKNFGTGITSNASLLRMLDEWLNPADRQPVAVGYCEQIYTSKTISPLSIPFVPRALRIKPTQCEAHYSLIVGRRSDWAGKCEYLIRNSHGTDFWTEKWDCLCSSERTGKNEACRYRVNSPKPARGQKVLGCWAPQDELAPYVYDLEQL